ncbi:hypothetical protein COE51_01375 [Bacillus pseudomycoides]|nr:hypothetical protein COE51_01375 [Bacillus pseudomycoides]
MNEREQTIEMLKSLKDITVEKQYVYVLDHEYDTTDNSKVAFSTNIKPEIMSPLLAYIEFAGEEINESFTLHQDEAVNLIYKHYAKTTLIENYRAYDRMEIDLYWNREYWCGSGVWDIEVFKRDSLVEELTQKLNK